MKTKRPKKLLLLKTFKHMLGALISKVFIWYKNKCVNGISKNKK